MVSIDSAKEVLKPFFFTPTKPKYIREIAKDCKLSYERVQHYLKELEKIKAMEPKVRGRIKEYSINRKHELVLKIFSILEMERRQKFYAENPKIGVSLQTISNETSAWGACCLILFGSAARGDAKEGSDIDLLLVLKHKGEASDEQLAGLAKKMEALSGKRFSLHAVPIEEMRARWKKEPFYTTLWQDHVLLHGDEAFWKEVLEMGEPI